MKGLLYNPMFNASMGLLAAGGPSRFPVGIGQALQQGLLGAQRADMTGRKLGALEQEQALKQQQMQMEAEAMRQEQEQARQQAAARQEFISTLPAEQQQKIMGLLNMGVDADKVFDGAGLLGGMKKPPPTREINRGGEVVTQEWDGSSWSDIAAGPRFNPNSGTTIQNIMGGPPFDVPSGFMPDPVNPAAGVVPIPGGPQDPERVAAAERREMEASANQVSEDIGTLNRYKDLVNKHGTEMMDREVVSRLALVRGDIMSIIARARNLGVLQDGEREALESQIRDPTSFWNNITLLGKDAMIAPIDDLLARMKAKEQQLNQRGVMVPPPPGVEVGTVGPDDPPTVTHVWNPATRQLEPAQPGAGIVQ